MERGDPGELTVENASRKARAVAAPGAGETVIACDTVVSLDGRIYGKPDDLDHARETLAALAGRTHEVTSGLVVLTAGEERTAIAHTEVSFRAMGRRMLDWYLGSDEWRERAGGYAIQGGGAALVEAINGDWTNVVGLPVGTLLELLPGLLGAG
jgi:septum formation protein